MSSLWRSNTRFVPHKGWRTRVHTHTQHSTVYIYMTMQSNRCTSSHTCWHATVCTNTHTHPHTHRRRSMGGRVTLERASRHFLLTQPSLSHTHTHRHTYTHTPHYHSHILCCTLSKTHSFIFTHLSLIHVWNIFPVQKQCRTSGLTSSEGPTMKSPSQKVQSSFIYINQNHRFASRGFTVRTADSFSPETIDSDKEPLRKSNRGRVPLPGRTDRK